MIARRGWLLGMALQGWAAIALIMVWTAFTPWPPLDLSPASLTFHGALFVLIVWGWIERRRWAAEDRLLWAARAEAARAQAVAAKAAGFAAWTPRQLRGRWVALAGLIVMVGWCAFVLTGTRSRIFVNAGAVAVVGLFVAAIRMLQPQIERE